MHVGAWPGRELAQAPAGAPVWPRQLLLSRAFASQAGCYVILAGGLRTPEDVSEEFRALSAYNHTGDSCIIDPCGEVIAGPAEGEAILTARGSLEQVLMAKAAADGAGHYARPDVFQLTINRAPLEPLVERGAGQAADRTAPWRDGDTDGAATDTGGASGPSRVTGATSAGAPQ